MAAVSFFVTVDSDQTPKQSAVTVKRALEKEFGVAEVTSADEAIAKLREIQAEIKTIRENL